MTLEIIVVGSCMIDLVSYTAHLPKAGETVMGSQFQKSFGGKGANQAVQCALLGMNTAFCGRIGSDEFGEEYYQNFISHHINIDYLKRTINATTGVASISVDKQGLNTIVINPASNSLITLQDIQDAQNYISTAKILLCQNEIPYEATLEAFTIASRKSTLTIFNPAPAKPIAELREILTLSDIICPNESELATLTGQSTDTLEQIKKAGKYLLSEIYATSNIVVVTLGDRGAMIIRKNEIPILISIPTEYQVITAIDTVGAGDSFIGHMASQLARGVCLQEAVTKAVCGASLSVLKKGAQISYTLLTDLPVTLHPPSIVDISHILKMTQPQASLNQIKQRIIENLNNEDDN